VSRDYRGEGITIHWAGDLCIHSANCLRALPQVFDTSARPWIQPEDVSADALAAAVDTCPSRALTYTRSDGGPDGPGARALGSDEQSGGTGDAAVTVHVKPAGPLAVVGPARVVDADGEELAAGGRLFLCRCGHSNNKPLCDGSHKPVAFDE